MPMEMINSFDFQNIMHLLQYLAEHSEQPAAHVNFQLKVKSYHPSRVLDLRGMPQHDMVEATFYMDVTGIQRIQELMAQRNSTQVVKITWKGRAKQSVTIDCLGREVHVNTDSISFLELVRHKLTGQGVRRLSAQLSVQ